MSAKELGLVSNNESTDTKCKYHMTELKIDLKKYHVKLTLKIMWISTEKNVFEFPLKN